MIPPEMTKPRRLAARWLYASLYGAKPVKHDSLTPRGGLRLVYTPRSANSNDEVTTNIFQRMSAGFWGAAGDRPVSLRSSPKSSKEGWFPIRPFGRRTIAADPLTLPWPP